MRPMHTSSPIHTSTPSTITPNPMLHISTDAPVVRASWSRLTGDLKPICPTPKFATIGGELDVRI